MPAASRSICNSVPMILGITAIAVTILIMGVSKVSPLSAHTNQLSLVHLEPLMRHGHVPVQFALNSYMTIKLHSASETHAASECGSCISTQSLAATARGCHNGAPSFHKMCCKSRERQTFADRASHASIYITAIFASLLPHRCR